MQEMDVSQARRDFSIRPHRPQQCGPPLINVHSKPILFYLNLHTHGKKQYHGPITPSRIYFLYYNVVVYQRPSWEINLTQTQLDPHEISQIAWLKVQDQKKIHFIFPLRRHVALFDTSMRQVFAHYTL